MRAAEEEEFRLAAGEKEKENGYKWTEMKGKGGGGREGRRGGGRIDG